VVGLHLTHSATAIGLVVALQTLPVLLLGPYGEWWRAASDKRKPDDRLAVSHGRPAAILAVLSLTHVVTYVDVCVLAMVLGLNNAFETPSRQSFVLEMVGPNDLRNAVSLNSTMNNVARAVGPAIAGTIIAYFGEGWCFALNAVSFIAVVFSLMIMDKSTLSPSVPTERARVSCERLPICRATPKLLYPLIMMRSSGCCLRIPGDAADRCGHNLYAAPRSYGVMTGQWAWVRSSVGSGVRPTGRTAPGR